MTDISKERRAEMRRKAALAVDFGWDVDGVDPYDLLALLDAADKRDRLRAIYITPLTVDEQAIIDRAWDRDFSEKLAEAKIIVLRDGGNAKPFIPEDE